MLDLCSRDWRGLGQLRLKLARDPGLCFYVANGGRNWAIHCDMAMYKQAVLVD